MKVCIDIQAAIAQQAGVGRYTRQLVQGLAAGRKPDDALTLFYFDFKKKGLPFNPPDCTTHPVHLCPGRLAQLAWKTIGRPSFNFFAPRADLYHFPNFILPPLSGGKSVVTIHDLSFIRFPQFAEQKNLDYLSARIRDTVQRADAIITDSAFGATELQELLQVPEDKLFPIHLGISENFKPQDPELVTAALRRLGLDRPYLLTVGTVEPRKNLDFIVGLFEHMKDFDGRLVIAGMRGGAKNR